MAARDAKLCTRCAHHDGLTTCERHPDVRLREARDRCQGRQWRLRLPAGKPTIFPAGFSSPRGPMIAFGEGEFVDAPLHPVDGESMRLIYPGGITYYDDRPPYDENAGIPCGT